MHHGPPAVTGDSAGCDWLSWSQVSASITDCDGAWPEVMVLAVMQTCLQHLECWMLSEITFCDKTAREGDVMVGWGCVSS